MTDIGDDIDYRDEAHRSAMEHAKFKPRQRMNSDASSTESEDFDWHIEDVVTSSLHPVFDDQIKHNKMFDIL